MVNISDRGVILLTAAGFVNPKVAGFVVDLVKSREKKKVAIITTASEGKENNIYAKLAKEQLEKMGFGKITFFDLENEGSKSIINYDIVYVCGGNTFKLLKFARETNFKNVVQSVLNGGGLYIGVSAGSLLLCSSVQIANEINPDTNNVGLTDFSGLNIVDTIIYPHYDLKYEPEIKNFETRNNVTVTRLTNNQALAFKDQELKIVE